MIKNQISFVFKFDLMCLSERHILHPISIIYGFNGHLAELALAKYDKYDPNQAKNKHKQPPGSQF